MEKPEVTMMSRDDFADLVRKLGHPHVGDRGLWILNREELSVPVIKNLDAHVLAALEAGGELDMPNWHGADGRCGMTHCRGGWAIRFAGPAGYALEDALGAECAAACIYLASTGRVPDFFAENEEALEDIKCCAAESK